MNQKLNKCLREIWYKKKAKPKGQHQIKYPEHKFRSLSLCIELKLQWDNNFVFMLLSVDRIFKDFSKEQRP